MLLCFVFVKLQHRLVPPPLPLLANSKRTTSIQLLCHQSLADSPTQRHHHISLGINAFRPLFNVTGGVPPLLPFRNSPLPHPGRNGPFLFMHLRDPILQPFCFQILAGMAGVPPIRQLGRSDVQTFPIPISPLTATLMDLPESVANKRLNTRLSLLDATLAESMGRGSRPCESKTDGFWTTRRTGRGPVRGRRRVRQRACGNESWPGAILRCWLCRRLDDWRFRGPSGNFQGQADG